MKGSENAGRRNNNHRKKITMDTGTYSALGFDGILNDVTSHVDAAMKVVSPSVVEETTAIVTPLFVKKTLCHNHGVSSKHS
uniref:Uncharacterized protein n=1 Tax=Tanacetum cinerariifolium TaxID=118510 RepID=A0A699HNN2_TANCI|nr:hypothetical protein [Tanacetum cinerariifolium]